MATIEDLFQAIADGDGAGIRSLLAEDPSLATASLDGVSALRRAAYVGRPELADLLGSLGARPDGLDLATLGRVDELREALDADPGLATAFADDGFTALHLAAWFGHEKVAELLLARGADPEAVATNGTGLQPLHSAAAGGHPVIAHLLLDRGADIEATQAGGVRALHSAAHRDDVAMVRLLLERGADPTATTDDGRTPRDLATGRRGPGPPP
ncbi:MAG: ankyrin repeat domain-containing protein [Acidimicrobiales bacterium]